MSEMVERVAKAIHAELRANADALVSGERIEDILIDGYIDLSALARAVLAAMLDPTDAMLEEGAGVIPCRQGVEEGPPNLMGARDCWQEMIAAALTPTPPHP